jgi:hypothetical protein
MTTREPSNAFEYDDIEHRFLSAGVVVPADRAEGAFGAASRLLAVLHFVRTPRTAAAEPAHIFTLPHETRK